MTEGHFDTKTALKLDGEGRVKELRPFQLLEDIAGVHSGMVCVDLGCGTGTFTIPMATMSGNKGLVCAIDDSDDMLRFLLTKNLPQNLIVVKSDAAKLGLKSSIVDFCLLAFILHEFQKHDAVIKEAHRLLKPGGKIMVVEWKTEFESPGPPKERRISQERLEKLFKHVALMNISFQEWSIHHYIAVATKQ
jgi:ubiquinone/menaquinone biosynthesis C-methylase UbiE